MPETYRAWIARYYQSLAKAKKWMAFANPLPWWAFAAIVGAAAALSWRCIAASPPRAIAGWCWRRCGA